MFSETLVLVDGNEALNFGMVTTAFIWVREEWKGISLMEKINDSE